MYVRTILTVQISIQVALNEANPDLGQMIGVK